MLLIKFTDESEKPLKNVKVLFNDVPSYTSVSGSTSTTTFRGARINVIATLEGYNRFEKAFDVESSMLVEAQLSKSGGTTFMDGNMGEENIFYDKQGAFGIIPYWTIIVSLMLITIGVLILRRE